MFSVKDSQRVALDQSTRRLFHERLYLRLESRHCQSIKSRAKADVIDQMEVWHRRGQSYEMNTKKAIGRFLGMHLTIRPDFDLNESMQKVLREPGMSGDQKMEALFIRLRRVH